MHLTVCIATDYGRLMLPEHKALTVLASRLNEQDMEKLMSRNTFDCILDATHPTPYLSLRTSETPLRQEHSLYKDYQTG